MINVLIIDKKVERDSLYINMLDEYFAIKNLSFNFEIHRTADRAVKRIFLGDFDFIILDIGIDGEYFDWVDVAKETVLAGKPVLVNYSDANVFVHLKQYFQLKKYSDFIFKLPQFSDQKIFNKINQALNTEVYTSNFLSNMGIG